MEIVNISAKDRRLVIEANVNGHCIVYQEQNVMRLPLIGGEGEAERELILRLLKYDHIREDVAKRFMQARDKVDAAIEDYISAL